MGYNRVISRVGCHAAGGVGDVIADGVGENIGITGEKDTGKYRLS